MALALIFFIKKHIYFYLPNFVGVCALLLLFNLTGIVGYLELGSLEDICLASKSRTNP